MAAVNAGAPTDCVNCLLPTKDSWVQFLGEAFKKAAGLNIFSVSGVQTFVNNYLASVPESEKNCTAASHDANAIYTALGVADKTADQMQSKIMNNFLAHPFVVSQKTTDINNKWKAGQFEQAGHGLGELLQTLLA